MKLYVSVTPTNREESVFCLSSDGEYPVVFLTDELKLTVTRLRRDSLDEYIISFIPKKDIRLHSLKVSLPFAENRIGREYPIRVYDNGLCTNTFAAIRLIDEGSTSPLRSREIVTAHSCSGDLNAAFTSFDRFYTEFRTDNNAVTAFFALEDKTVKANEKYTLESLLIDEHHDGHEFFKKYSNILKQKYNVGEMKPIPAGWSSWSCLYGKVTEEDVIKQSRLIAENWSSLGADLIQIDDGWQIGGSFGGYWTADPTRFGGDIPSLREHIVKSGLRLGLWLAPGLIVDESDMFDSLYPCLLRKDGELIRSFGGNEALSATKNGSVYSLDIGNPMVLDYIKSTFSRCINEYGAVYFKIDFIMNLLLRLISDGSRVEYSDGYAIELYRRYVKQIREAVGDDIFLLACGAPIGESVGVFDSIRISPDITWEGADRPTHPGAWNILSGCATSAILRSPLHGKVFINDPDALLVRDYLTDKGNDGFALNYEEAKMWATVIATSGGHILLNEEIDKLSDERKDLFTSILPPLGIASQPCDFYEYPLCTEAFLEHDGARIITLYNWEDKPLSKEFKNPFDQPAVMVDCWSGEIIGLVDSTASFDLSPHTCRAFLIKPLNEGFLYSDGNFYLGIKDRCGKEYYYFPCGAPCGYERANCSLIDGIYTKNN